MFRGNLLRSIFVVLLGMSRVIYAADTEVILDSDTSSSGFAVRDASNNTIIRVVGDRNVGVGTTLPNEQLEITGNFRLPATTATSGIIKSGNNRFIHSFGINSFFAGVSAGNFTMTGANITAVGKDALQANTTGNGNTAVGFGTLFSNTTGDLNTAVGEGVLANNTSGNYNTAVGQVALVANTTGESNTAVGHEALSRNTTGLANMAIGVNALGSNTTGGGNTAVGAEALSLNDTGSGNTAVGVEALQNNKGEINTAVGFRADVSGNLVNATAIGAHAIVAASNSLVLGDNANVGIGTSAPTERLHVEGNIVASGAIGPVSSRAFKKDIVYVSTNEAMDALKDLNPVRFKYKEDNSGEEHLGFIADDVPELVSTQGRNHLSLMDFTAVLTKVVQEQQKMLQDQKKAMDAMAKKIETLESAIKYGVKGL